MYFGAIMFLAFFVSWLLYCLMVDIIATLIKRKRAKKRYLRRLETENRKLKRAVNFLSFELETKEE